MGEKIATADRTTLCKPSLPPGCRFYPTDEQLVSYYLTSKNNNSNLSGIDLIRVINLYNFEPFNLPETACFRYGRGAMRRHWFCYVAARGLRERGKRRAGEGYWRRRGRVRDVVCAGAGKIVVGTRKSFVFYLGDETKGTAVRTDWFMYEYADLDHPKASYVLCRVFVKSHCRNNQSEPLSSSCAEECSVTVRHIGPQCDGTEKLAVAEAKTNDEIPVDCDNEAASNLPMRITCELNAHINNPFIAGQMSMNDALTAQELVAILEEDFMELEDLACPLPGID